MGKGARLTRDLEKKNKRLKKLEEKYLKGNYWEAYVHLIQTGEMPKHPVLKKQFEFEQRSIQAMVATLPQPDPETCRKVRLKTFGTLDCQGCTHCDETSQEDWIIED